MMFHVDVNGRTREVAIERDARGFTVAVDGEARLVNVAAVGPSTFSLIVLGDRVMSHQIGLPDPAAADNAVYVDGVPVQAALVTKRRRRGGAGEAAGGPGAQRVTAPMPGKVVRILVAPGDTVKARQPVVVVEAMKMENELRAPKDGSVTEVTVTQGASVEAGTVLLVIE